VIPVLAIPLTFIVCSLESGAKVKIFNVGIEAIAPLSITSIPAGISRAVNVSHKFIAFGASSFALGKYFAQSAKVIVSFSSKPTDFKTSKVIIVASLAV
jgi:hypothetical protein